MRRSSPSVYFKVRKPRGGWYEITEHSSDAPNVGSVVAKTFGEQRARFVADALQRRAFGSPSGKERGE